ncbi:MAG: T9SS type A sorting domain-containing protein, partial [Bacteroidia bacterium]
TVTATGGTGTSTFEYAIDGNPPQINNIFSDVSAGDHDIEITDADSCSIIFSVNVTSSAGLSVSSIQTSPADCNGVGGSLTLIGSGGTPPYQYSLDDTANFNNPTQFSNLPAGNTTAYIRDANLCIDSTIVTIGTANGVEIDDSNTLNNINNVSCFGLADGSINVFLSSGQGPFNYSLTGILPVVPSVNNSTGFFDNLSTGSVNTSSYQIIVTDALGCSDTIDFPISQEPLLSLSITNPTNPTCNNPTSGSFNANTTGGVEGAYTYFLNNTLTSPGAPPTFNNLGVGLYNLKVIDGNGCEATDMVTLVTPTTLTINNLTTIPVKCNGGTDGSISFDATNAPGLYTVSINAKGNPTIIQSFSNIAEGATVLFANLAAGTFEVKVTDANGCDLVTDAEVLQPNLPIAIGLIQSQSQTVIPCYNASIGQLSVQGVGGNGNYDFDLYNALGALSSLNGDTVSFTALSSDMYGILLTDVNGCKDSAAFNITQVGRPTISFNAQDTSLCNQQDAITYIGTGIYVNAVFSDNSNLINNDSLIPALPNLQTDALINVFISGTDTSINMCAFADTFQVTIHPRPEAAFTMPADSLFCSSESTPILLSGSTTLLGSADSIFSADFDGNGVVDTTSFIPQQAGIGGQTLTYMIEDNFACRDTAIKKVFVLPNPSPAFVARDSVCEGQAINFVHRSSFGTSFANNSLQSFFNNPSLNYQILSDSARWLFQGESSSQGDSVFHIFERAGQASVLLIDTTSLIGCTSSLDTIVDVGDMPEPSFDWRNACLGDSTIFEDRTDSLLGVPRDKFASFDWTFGDGAADTNSIQYNPVHLYGQIDCCYPAKLKITTTLGCVDSLIKQVYILPIVDSYPYDQNFESGDGNWVSESETQRLWSWEELRGNALPGGSQGWQTASDTIYPANVNAYLNSACFDLSSLKRPAVAMEIWSDAEDADGTVLQVLYNDQDSAEWFVLGDIDNQGLASGLNWYNSAAIFSRPGDQEGGLGWTGSDTEFQLARHKLDALQDSGKVRFRLAFAADSRTPENTFLDGFGLDSVWIGERDRTLSIEAFTEDTIGITALRRWQNENPQDAIVIRYPFADPYFDANPAPPRARSLYYGISVPEQIVMDGNAYNDALANFSQKQISLRSLVAANFQIDIDTSGTVEPFKLTALQDFSSDQELVVSILVVEKTADQVMQLRKMLPDPAGMSFYGWGANQSTFLSMQWQASDQPTPEIVDEYDSLAVVVIVQDQASKEVLQAAISPIWAEFLDPSLVQRKAGPQVSDNTYKVFPNPSTGIFTLRFGVPDPGQKTIQVWDMQGRTVYQENIWGEITEWKLNLSALAAGVYQLSV